MSQAIVVQESESHAGSDWGVDSSQLLKRKTDSLQPAPQDWVKVALKTKQGYNYHTIQCSYHEIL